MDFVAELRKKEKEEKSQLKEKVNLIVCRNIFRALQTSKNVHVFAIFLTVPFSATGFVFFQRSVTLPMWTVGDN